jgi:hypothetical protein
MPSLWPGPSGGLLDLNARNQTHLFPVYAYGGVLPLLTVRNYLRRKKLPRQADRLWDHVLMRRRSCARGDEGGRIVPLSTSPSLEDTDLVEVPPRLFVACPAAR